MTIASTDPRTLEAAFIAHAHSTAPSPDELDSSSPHQPVARIVLCPVSDYSDQEGRLPLRDLVVKEPQGQGIGGDALACRATLFNVLLLEVSVSTCCQSVNPWHNAEFW